MAHKIDFEKLVREAREDFPQETSNITFLDLSALTPDEVNAAMLTWLGTTSPEYQEKWRSNNLCSVHGAENNGFAAKDPASGKALLAIPSITNGFQLPDTFIGLVFPIERACHLIFFHELGHLIVEGGMGKSDVADQLGGENRADCFAMLYGIKKGIFEVSDISVYSYERACEATWLGDPRHGTHLALDALADICKSDDIASLSWQEIKNIAYQAAERCITSFDEVKNAKYAFVEVGPHRSRDDVVALLADVYEKEPESFSGKTGLKLLRSYFNDARIRHAWPSVSIEDRERNDHIRQRVGIPKAS